MYLEDDKITRSQLVRRYAVRRQDERRVVISAHSRRTRAIIAAVVILTVFSYPFVLIHGMTWIASDIVFISLVLGFPIIFFTGLFYLAQSWSLTLDEERQTCVKKIDRFTTEIAGRRLPLLDSYVGPHDVPVTWTETEMKNGGWVSALPIGLIGPIGLVLQWVVSMFPLLFSHQVEKSKEFPGIIHYDEKSGIATVLLVFNKPEARDGLLEKLAETSPDHVLLH